MTGFSHVPSFRPGACVTGHVSSIEQGYNKQPSAWGGAPVVLFKNGERTFAAVKSEAIADD